MSLDRTRADVAASIVVAAGVSVADAHIGAVGLDADGEVVVLVSDPWNLERAAAPALVRAVRV